ncbi:MAG: hypothetical protein P4L50_15990 [Anaerolineaceae bacterium]|nr:hypothetical protein [Anaerolineaceae bacterium]
MPNRLKLFFLVLFLESAAAAGVLAVRGGAIVKGAGFFGYGRFHFLLLAAMLAAAFILAIVTFLVWKRASLESRWSNWLAALRSNPARNKSAVVVSLAGTVLTSLAVLAGVFFLTNYQSIVMQVLPILVFIVLACLEVFILLAVEPGNSAKYVWIGRAVLLILFLFLMAGYVRGAFEFSKWVNRTPTGGGVSDQAVYMQMMAAAHKNPLTFIGDGNRMPLFSLIEAIFYNPQAAYQDSFERGKAVNIYLSLLVLAGLFVFFQRSWKSWFTTVNLVLIVAFEVYIFKSAYFTTEVIYYFFGFLSFVFLAMLFVRPSYKIAAAAGVFTTLAYLAKASTLASVTFFGVVWFFAVAVGWVGRAQGEYGNESGEKGPAARQSLAARYGKPALIGGTVVVVFVGLIIPFGLQNSQRYGGFFNNINSSVVMWTDSWAQFKTVAYDYGIVRLMEMPASQRPSLQTYVATHNVAQALRRFSKGFGVQLKNVLYPFNTVNYPLVLVGILLAAAVIYHKRTLELLGRYKAVVLFVLSYLLGYFVLFCWYGVIDTGPRFVLGLFLPLLFSIYTALYQYRDKQVPGIKGFGILNAVNVVLIVLISVDAYVVLSSYLLAGQFGF